MIMKKWLILCVAVMMMCGVALAAGEESSDSALEKIDMTAWQYEEEHDVYWQVGIPYASNPADAAYETMGFFVPGAYFTGTKNDNGTYTCEVNPSGVAAGYTALTAPLVIPVNTPGYAAMQAPTDFSSRMGYGSIEDYTSAGLIVLFAGARGRDAGAPAGVTDFKAAIRYTRYNADRLPGNMDCIFSLGMSGGGAQSTLIGATGNSPLYTPYLEEIGAVEGVSDAVMGSMCWCPITNLDVADEAYEWNMGNTRTELTQEEQALSDGMAAAFAQYINSLGLTDENGVALTLTASENGICQSGTYYDYILRTIEESLNHFLTDNAFPYTVASGAGGAGGAGGNRTGRVMPENGEFAAGERNPQGNPFGETGAAPYEALDQINRTTANTAAVTLSGTYNTVQDYIDALNSAGEWVTYDSASNTVRITSVSDFTTALKVASKGIAAFDNLNRTQGENVLFGYQDGQGAHFDAILAELVAGTAYEAEFAADLARTDSLGNTVDVRLNMYNPMYFLMPYYEGYRSSEVAQFWRIRSGINQGDTALCTEINLALALAMEGKETDFETVWGMAHTEAERTGDSTHQFIEWVNQCMMSMDE